jgi:hypothetical protein
LLDGRDGQHGNDAFALDGRKISRRHVLPKFAGEAGHSWILYAE